MIYIKVMLATIAFLGVLVAGAGVIALLFEVIIYAMYALSKRLSKWG